MKTNRIIILIALIFFASVNIANAQTKEMDKVKADIAELLKNKIAFYENDGTDNPNPKRLSSPKNILVLDDRIELNIKKTVRTVYFTDKLDNPSGVNYVSLGDLTFIEFKSGNAKKLADNLRFIQNQLNEKRYSSDLVLFEPIAAQYCALKVKPPVSEEQREYIVQANSFNQKKMYSKAIELYIKAINMDQTAYPAAYSNLALLSAQVNKFDAAVYYMKKYLLLQPDASDARTARDKIYEWKIQITK